MSTKVIEQIAKNLENEGENLTGLTDSQISALEQKLPHRFPAVYRRFLKLMGVSAGRYMRGSSAFYDELSIINLDAREMLIQNGEKELQPSDFVFWMHQGYQFPFFILNSEDDPPVYYYMERQHSKGIEKIADSLSDFFTTIQ